MRVEALAAAPREVMELRRAREDQREVRARLGQRGATEGVIRAGERSAWKVRVRHKRRWRDVWVGDEEEVWIGGHVRLWRAARLARGWVRVYRRRAAAELAKAAEGLDVTMMGEELAAVVAAAQTAAHTSEERVREAERRVGSMVCGVLMKAMKRKGVSGRAGSGGKGGKWGRKKKGGKGGGTKGKGRMVKGVSTLMGAARREEVRACLRRYERAHPCDMGAWGIGLDPGPGCPRLFSTGERWAGGPSTSPLTPLTLEQGVRGPIAKRWWSKGARLRAMARAAGSFYTYDRVYNSHGTAIQDNVPDTVFEPLSIENGMDVSGVT